jgi:hypothetical protein
MVSNSLSTWFGGALVFIPLTFLFFAPALAVHAWNVETVLTIEETGVTYSGMLVRGGLTLFASVLCSSLAAAGFCYAVFRRLQGTHVGTGEALRRGLSRLPAAFGISLIITLAVTAALLPAALLVTSWGLAIPAMLVGIVAVIWFLVVWSLAIPASVIEGLGPKASLARSMQLTRGSRLSIFGCWFLLGLAVWLLQKPIDALFASGSIDGLDEVDIDAEHSMIRLQAWVETAVQVLFNSVQAVSVGVAYFGLRRAREGALPDEMLKVFE